MVSYVPVCLIDFNHLHRNQWLQILFFYRDTIKAFRDFIWEVTTQGKKSQDQMGKLCLDLKVDLERIVFFSDQKIANCCCYFNYYKPSTTMLRSSLSFYLKAKLTKHLYMQRRSSFFAWISRKHTSTFNNKVLSEFSH